MSKIKNTSRRLSREIVLQALYAYELNKIEKKSDVFLKKNFDFIKSILKDHKIDDNGKKFINKLFSLNIEKSEWSRNQIEEKLENWDITRVATIDLLILQMMIVEMFFVDDVPLKVSITEGVEIAKKFSTDESSSFINGILDSFYKVLNNE
tara:strand:+ start:207 stop:659 length:453 start_codon:yes stop_codon:yes gene_type:complete